MFDYAERRRRLGERMEAEGVGALFLAPSADLEYLTGVERHIPSFGEASYAHGWVTGAFFRPDADPVFVLPRMFAAFDLREQPEGEVVIVNETDDGFAAFERVARGLGPNPTTAVGDRVWAETVLNLGRIPGFEDLRTHIVDPDRMPDEGSAGVHPSAGATAVGARIPLIAYNVNLKTTDLRLAKDIAKTIRASSGGLPNVKALGFALGDRGLVQVSMNLTDYRVTNIWKVFRVIRDEAERRGVEVEASEIVGTIPLAAAVGVIKDAIVEPAFRMDQILEKRVWAAE